MIELAPGHKQGLPVDNPMLLSGGVIGYGESVPAGLALGELGAVVIGPFAATSRPGNPPPRMAATNGGVVLNTGGQTRGVKAAVKRFSRLWPRMGVPVVAQIVDGDPVAAGRTAAALAGCNSVLGLELAIASDDDEQIRKLIRAITKAADLPLWAKLPFERAADLADIVVRAGAHGLVIGQPPRARLPKCGGWVSGELFGPLVFATTIHALSQVVQLKSGVPIIACGGIHTTEQMQQALDAGAQAIQIDSGVWVEPALPNWLLAAWRSQVQRESA